MTPSECPGAELRENDIARQRSRRVNLLWREFFTAGMIPGFLIMPKSPFPAWGLSLATPILRMRRSFVKAAEEVIEERPTLRMRGTFTHRRHRGGDAYLRGSVTQSPFTRASTGADRRTSRRCIPVCP